MERLIGNRGGPSDDGTYHKEEFWLQPKYGYAVVKHVVSDCPAVADDPLRNRLVYEYNGFQQSPRGIWYPTVSRWKNAVELRKKTGTGGRKFGDRVTYFYLDFTADLPDAAFRPDR